MTAAVPVVVAVLAVLALLVATTSFAFRS